MPSFCGEISCNFEQEARLKGFRQIAGLDEAGRGPLAGPVVAAACLIEEGLIFPGVNDCKQLSPPQRKALYAKLSAHPGVLWAIGLIDHQTIDKINIYQATIQAMMQAVGHLQTKPDYLLVDGLKLPHPDIPSKKIIKGDTLSHSIACASILAKVTRDKVMEDYDRDYPGYGFAEHKGYGTPKHLKALKERGPCPIHRMTFAPLKCV